MLGTRLQSTVKPGPIADSWSRHLVKDLPPTSSPEATITQRSQELVKGKWNRYCVNRGSLCGACFYLFRYASIDRAETSRSDQYKIIS